MHERCFYRSAPAGTLNFYKRISRERPRLGIRSSAESNVAFMTFDRAVQIIYRLLHPSGERAIVEVKENDRDRAR